MLMISGNNTFRLPTSHRNFQNTHAEEQVKLLNLQITMLMRTCVFMLMLQTGFTQNFRADNLMVLIIFITVKSWHLREEYS